MTTPSDPVGGAAIDDYLIQVPDPQRTTLTKLRATLRAVLPDAEEKLKYGMPAFVVDGHGIAGYAAFKHHCGYFPMSSAVLVAAGDAVAEFTCSKGGLQFPVDRPLSKKLVARLVKLRLDEFGVVNTGRRVEYFPDGRLKARGPMKNGQLHGRWEWFRKDGTLMRTGKFADGEQTGTWTTYNAAGQPSKTTEF
ncbi:MAG: DUF1801 domain-containing protein [Ilumatobacteraceae bacterium]